MEIQKILDGEDLVAMILRHNVSEPGVHFFTPPDFPMQLGQMSYQRGHIIKAHKHKAVRRDIVGGTQEVLFIRKGSVRVDLYTQKHELLSAHHLYQGDVIFLAGGAHGFEATDDLDMVEIKQGPFLGDHEKASI